MQYVFDNMLSKYSFFVYSYSLNVKYFIVFINNLEQTLIRN